MERTEGLPDREAVGIVLAGGRATRLGSMAATGKAWLELDGRTFLDRVVAAVAPEVASVVVVAADNADPPGVAGVTVVRDTMPLAGPLAAIRDGIRAAIAAGGPRPPRRCVVVSCDVPLVRRELVRMLLEVARGDMHGGRSPAALWTLPVVHGHLQVLVSVFDVRMLSWLEAWLATGRRDPRGLATSLLADEPAAVRLVDESLLAAVDPTLASFRDVDTPEDLDRLSSSAVRRESS